MKSKIKITKEDIKEIAKYKEKYFPKYTSSLINLLNRWAGGTSDKIVGQMSEEVMLCPYRKHSNWRKWYLKRHPNSIKKSINLIMKKRMEVLKQYKKINKKLMKRWVDDLVIDKSYWGIKIQGAIIKKLKTFTNKRCRVATKKEERSGYDGFIGRNPIQIKPKSYRNASNVRSEILRAKVIYYEKNKDGSYDVNIKEIKRLL